MKDLITVKELSEILSVNVHTIYAWIRTEKIPFFNIGVGENQVIRFSKAEVLEWLSKRKQG